MKDVFITVTGATYPLTGTASSTKCNGVWDSDSLPAGTLGIFNQDGSIIGDATDVNANVAAADLTGDNILIQGITSAGARTSINIARKGFEYNKVAYVAPVKAVKFLGSNVLAGTGSEKGNLNLPSSIAVGDVVGVTVIDKTKDSWEQGMEPYDFIVTTGDLLTGTTAKNIIAKLIVLINADTNRVVDAVAVNDGAGNNDGIKFTGRTAGEDFGLARFDGVLKDADICEYKIVNDEYEATVANTVAIVTGNGTYALILKMLTNASVYGGNINSERIKDQMYTMVSNIVLAETYAVYYLSFTAPVTGTNAHQLQANPKTLIAIVVPEGETATNELEDALDAILPLVAS